ncbi:phosphatase 2C-like domain-containing protein [Lipomyces oligophaga]|uniref:phosphatase 2C-like domain-containing protein n=1 Tax=Lipomyces oligophaga TaxID=45792 RepID=UPI0034CE626E
MIYSRCARVCTQMIREQQYSVSRVTFSYLRLCSSSFSTSSSSSSSSSDSSSSSSSSSSSKPNGKSTTGGRFAAATAVVTVAASALYVATQSSGEISSLISRVVKPTLVHNDARPAPDSFAGSIPQSPRQVQNYTTKITHTLSENEIAERLQEHQESYLIEGGGGGVSRFDITQLASNAQIEDDYVVRVVDIDFADGKSDWYFFGVFDGHGGWNTSARLRETIVPYVARELLETVKPGNERRTFSDESDANARLVDRAIERAFLRLDDDIVKRPVEFLLENPYKPASPEILMPAFAGSCALLSIYDPVTQTLRVACTGDSRAVWGHKAPDHTWVATPLSYDHTCRNETEANRIRNEHPHERDTVIQNDRVLGRLEPSRAFGDARFKLPAIVIENAARLFFGRGAPKNSLTPPYVTAKPEIVSTKVEPGDFLIMATDGVWDELSSQEVVSLVAEWARKHQIDHGNKPPSGVKPVARNSWLRALDLKDIHVISDTTEFESRIRERELPEVERLARMVAQTQKHFFGRFTVKDANAATHIVRNALGGADMEQTAMLLSIPSPLSRRFRDDMTCIVIFFGDPPQFQKNKSIPLQPVKIVPLEEASAPSASKTEQD